MIDGEVANGILLCLVWTDQKSEASYKSENERWRVLMRYLKGMGMLREEECHGKAFRVLGDSQRGHFDFSDDSSDDVDNDTDEQVELMKGRLKKFASTRTSQLRDVDATAESDVGRNWAKLFDILGSPRGEEHSAEDDSSADPSVEGKTTEHFDDESVDSTPVLTPSSSTMSLNSVFGASRSMSGLPGIWKSDCDISCRHNDIAGDTSNVDPCQDGKEDDRLTVHKRQIPIRI